MKKYRPSFLTECSCRGEQWSSVKNLSSFYSLPWVRGRCFCNLKSRDRRPRRSENQTFDEKTQYKLWIRLWKGCGKAVDKLIFSENNQKISKKLCKSAWQKSKGMVIYASCRRWGDVNTWKEKWKKLEISFGKGVERIKGCKL